MSTRGKWADGIEPREFIWILPGRLAVCERPGGYGDSHRRVRRQEELIWIARNPIDLVCSLSEAPHNLHSYEEHGLPYCHFPWPARADLSKYLRRLTEEITQNTDAKNTVLVHKGGIGDEIVSFVGAYLLLTGRVQGGPNATAIAERIFERRLGPTGRAVIEVALALVEEDPPQPRVSPEQQGKPAAKKAAVRKAGAKKPAAKKAAVKKPAVKKPAAKKPAAKRAVIKKPPAKRAVIKKPAIKKPPAKKTAARSTTRRTAKRVG